MAVFTEETSLYEILIRVQPGGAWAAQYQTLTEIKKDGSVIGSSVSDVAPLTEQNAEAYDVIQQLLGESAANTAVVNEALRSQLSEALLKIETLEMALDSAMRSAGMLQTQFPQLAYAGSETESQG